MTPWKEKTMINQRTEFALRSLQPGINFSELCQEYGISRRVGYKWKKRFEEQGACGLSDRSRRPQNSPSEIDEDTICRIARLHERHKKWGPKKIRELYSRSYSGVPSESTFKRIFEKSGWVKKRKHRKHTEAGRIRTGIKAQATNEVWTVDFKGWWRTGDGERCEPLTVRDEFSRYVLAVRSMRTTRTEAVRAVFEKLFEEYGLPKTIRSDNGSPFAANHSILGLTRLSAWWVALGINLERGRPGKPQDNGAHERMHLDICNELECCASGSVGEQQAAFDVWRKTFNEERPHEALGMKTPAEVYVASQEAYDGTPEDLQYEGKLSRRVQKNGCIKIRNRNIPISSALAGWSVGLFPDGNDHYDVTFANLRLGQIEISAAAFLGVASHPEEGPADPQQKVS